MTEINSRESLLFKEDKNSSKNGIMIVAVFFSVMFVASLARIALYLFGNIEDITITELWETVAVSILFFVTTITFFVVRFKSKKLRYYILIYEAKIIINDATDTKKEYQAKEFQKYEVIKETDNYSQIKLVFCDKTSIVVTTRSLNEIKLALELLCAKTKK